MDKGLENGAFRQDENEAVSIYIQLKFFRDHTWLPVLNQFNGTQQVDSTFIGLSIKKGGQVAWMVGHGLSR